MRIRLLGAALVVLGLGALAAGIVVARGGSSRPSLETGPPGVLAQGRFRSLGWATNGTAALVRGPSGLTIRLGRDFRTQKAPELYVYVSGYARAGRAGWTQVAPLRSPWGGQEYAVASGAVRSARLIVTIFCAKCNRAFGEARLAPVRRV